MLRVLAAAEKEMQRRSGGACPNRGCSRRFVHKSAFVDPGCELGEGTRIWHFSHVLGGVRIGRHCVIGQNAMIGPDVTVGNTENPEQCQLYRGVTLRTACSVARPACSPMF